jgi:hypothetical protein
LAGGAEDDDTIRHEKQNSTGLPAG